MSVNLKFEDINEFSCVKEKTFTQQLVKKPEILFNDADFKTKFPGLNECHCPLLDRVTHPEWRKTLENKVIECISEQGLDQTKTLRIASVGSGSCFQELVLLTKLLDKGFTDIQFILIDPVYVKKTTTHEHIAVESFKSFIKSEISSDYPKAKIDIEVQGDFEEYLQQTAKENQPHAFLLIDLFDEGSTGKTVFEECMPVLDSYSKLIDKKTIIAFSKFEPMSTEIGVGGASVCSILSLQSYNLFKMLNKVRKFAPPKEAISCRMKFFSFEYKEQPNGSMAFGYYPV